VAHEVLDAMDKVPPGVPAYLRPALAPMMAVVGNLGRFISIGTLPQGAREKLGLRWTSRDERNLRIIGRTIARADALFPERVRYMPIAYRAREAARAQERLERTLANRPL